MYKYRLHGKSMYGKGRLCDIKPMSGKVLLCSGAGMMGGGCAIYNDLYLEVGRCLEEIFYKYSLGRTEEVAAILTREYYEKVAAKLCQLQQPNNDTYEGIRMLINRVLEGINYSIYQAAENREMESELIKLRDQVEMLHDTERLNEYIQNLNEQNRKRLIRLPDQTVTAMAASLKPKYALYLQRYGFPEGGVFEVDRMALICKELGIE